MCLRQSNEVYLLTIVSFSGKFIHSLLKTHKIYLRKIQIKRCIVLEAIKPKT